MRDAEPRWRMLNTDAGEFAAPHDLERRARDLGIEIVALEGHDPDDIAAAGVECDGLFLYRATVDDELLERLPRCRVLARCGTGYERIDVEAAARRGVMVTYVPDFCTEEMSETVLLFVLAFARRLPRLMWAARERRWLSISEIVPTPRRLTGRTLAILGFGRTGQRTAEKASALGLDVRVWTRTPRPEALERSGAREASFEEALACDYVALHLPLTDATTGLIGREELARFRPDGVLINVARGPIVDTDALVDALREGRLGGAALDVVEPSPLPPGHPLWELSNVLVTSHSASLSVEALREALSTAIEDAAAFLGGRLPRFPIPELRDTVAARL